ncbi:hypothetical protein TcWFU_008924 [Taenia crassiceps]|uniref:Uncharacterized protein n=1 Tax=Taenia crassiceps TaxID=6207 RepID=A0ABR4Q3I0_9CEST
MLLSAMKKKLPVEVTKEAAARKSSSLTQARGFVIIRLRWPICCSELGALPFMWPVTRRSLCGTSWAILLTHLPSLHPASPHRILIPHGKRTIRQLASSFPPPPPPPPELEVL